MQTYSGTAVADSAAHSDPQARASFILSTYLHLFGAIVVFVGLMALWFVTPVAVMLLHALGAAGRFGMLALMLGFMGASTLANSWARSANSTPMQYAGLGLYVFVESIIFVPLIAIALMATADSNPYILPEAGAITLTLFGCLTGIVFVTRKDFSFMRGVLFWGGIAATVLVIASLIFGFSLGVFFLWAMVALAGGYILYDTSNVLHHYRTNQPVAAALALFASFALLLWYVIRLLSRRR